MLLGTHDATFLWRHHEPLVDSRSRLICPGGKSRSGRPLDWSWHGRVADRLGIMDLCWLVMNGVPLSEVRKLLRHSSIQMTERYAHLGPDHLHNAVANLGFSAHFQHTEIREESATGENGVVT